MLSGFRLGRCLQFVDFEVRTGPRRANDFYRAVQKRRALLSSVERTYPCGKEKRSGQPEAHQLMRSCMRVAHSSQSSRISAGRDGTMVACAPARARVRLFPSFAHRCTSMREKGRKFVHLVRTLPDFQQSCRQHRGDAGCVSSHMLFDLTQLLVY